MRRRCPVAPLLLSLALIPGCNDAQNPALDGQVVDQSPLLDSTADGPGPDSLDSAADGPGLDATTDAPERDAAPDLAQPPVGTLTVYPPLPNDLYRSPRYSVAVNQGSKQLASYVYKSVNTLDPTLWSRPYMTDANHWTSFSFSGQVTVSVTLPLRTSITSVTIRPLSRKITATISNNSLSFTITKPGSFYVEIDKEAKHPLFVFANPPEANVPSPADPKVIYFKPGLHDVGKTYSTISSNTTIYIAGGAYVKGLLSGVINADPITIRGRGILSGIAYPHAKTWTNHLINLPGSKLQTKLSIEGITLTDGPKACVITRGKTSIDNVKFLGWHVNTDGVSTGADSTISNSFFKVNDDVIKLYDNNMVVTNNVIWHQLTGSAFQLSWNLSKDVSGCKVSQIDFIRFDRTAGNFSLPINNAVVACANVNGATLGGMVFSDLRLEGAPYQLVNLAIKGAMTGYTSGKGTIQGLTFRDVSAPQSPVVPSLLAGNGAATGEVKSITFDNLVIGGKKITADKDAQGKVFLVRQGKTSNIVYK